MHELGSISSSKEKGAPGSCRKWKALWAEGGREQGRTDYLIFLWGIEMVYMADYFTDADQKVSDWLAKTKFLWNVKDAFRLPLRPRFGYVGLAQGTPFGACFFHFKMIDFVSITIKSFFLLVMLGNPQAHSRYHQYILMFCVWLCSFSGNCDNLLSSFFLLLSTVRFYLPFPVFSS